MKPKPKTLGQIAFEAHYGKNLNTMPWSIQSAPYKKDWHNIARAVAREVKRRAKK